MTDTKKDSAPAGTTAAGTRPKIDAADIPVTPPPFRADGSHRDSPPMEARTVLMQITSKTPVHIHSGRMVYPQKTRCSPEEAKSLLDQGLAVRLPGV